MAEPIPAQKAPFKVKVDAGRSYYWCACGRSSKQPFCDSSHVGTGLVPLHYKAEETKDVAPAEAEKEPAAEENSSGGDDSDDEEEDE